MLAVPDQRFSGPCAIDVPPEQFAEQPTDVNLFLAGRTPSWCSACAIAMAARAEVEDFEVAAALATDRRRRAHARHQHIVQDEFVDQDVRGLYREADTVEFVVLFVRGGLVGRRAFQQKGQELPDPAVIAEYVQQYDATGRDPDEVVVGVELQPARRSSSGSSQRAARKTSSSSRVAVSARAWSSSPSQRGGLGDVAAWQGCRHRGAAPEGRRSAVAAAAAERIECFDVAHIQGSETVASMVTFVDGVPARGLYRKFKVRSVENNDFAAMYEVLTRRFKRASDDPAWAWPDLLVIDGGKGQLGMAVTALSDLHVPLGGAGVEIIGLAKERDLEAGSAPDRVFRRNVKDSIALRSNSPELYVLARIRDEAHRFANTFHRDRRTKQTLRSELDTIPGIGATRRQRLLKHFGSVRAIRHASVEDLAKAPGMNRKVAESIVRYFAEVAAAMPDAQYEE